MKKTLSIVACVALCNIAFAENIELDAISINGKNDTKTNVQQKRILQDEVEKIEVIDRKDIAKSQSATFSAAIQNEAGVSVETGCSICGLKRVQINGLTGDHTTILVDGSPFNSTVSSFYGTDAIGTADIESIELTRGAGASLIAPEAIGGTVNIIPRKPKENGSELDVSAGSLGTRVYSVLGETMSKDKKTGILISASSSEQSQVDRDKNGISESPEMKNQAISAMLTHKFSPSDSIEIKGSHFTSDVKGGTMVSKNVAIAEGGDTVSFAGNNVNNSYTGDPLAMIEDIQTTRDEVYAKERHTINDNMNLQTTLAFSRQKQDSLYEGADYLNVDKTYFGDIKIDHVWNDKHFLTYGIDAKVEQARSKSDYYYVQNNRPHDDFNYGAYGIYGQDAWTIDSADELTFALRGEKITTNWLDQKTKGNEIDKLVLLPRLLFRHDHTNNLTSRFSCGMGYRSPLTFFESEHGLLDNGFGIDISAIEKSNGANYSLAYKQDKLSITGSASYTQVKNLAYIDTSSGIPTLRNSVDAVGVKEADIVAGYIVNDDLTLSGSYEAYMYNNDYKSLMSLAPVEQRARFSVDYDYNGWDIYSDVTFVGARNLSKYGYDGYDVWDGVSASSPKNTKAPSFVTVDLKVSKEISKNFTLYAGAKNILDYVQTDKQTPLFYDSEGGFDSAYIWGPLRGRTLYVGLKANF